MIKSKKQLDENEVLEIIKTERRMRAERNWNNFYATVMLVLFAVLFITIIWLLVETIVVEFEENKYERLCELKLEGIMFGREYVFDECYVWDKGDYFECSCYYDLKENVWDFNKRFEIEKDWY